jgi:hypothetical protein
MRSRAASTSSIAIGRTGGIIAALSSAPSSVMLNSFQHPFSSWVEQSLVRTLKRVQGDGFNVGFHLPRSPPMAVSSPTQ